MREDEFRGKVTDARFLEWGLDIVGKDMSYTRLDCFSSLYPNDRVVGEMRRAYGQLIAAIDDNRKRGAITDRYHSKG